MNKDPKWDDCIDTPDFPTVFNIKSGFGPEINGELSWNRCWSHIPRLWEGPVRKLIDRIATKYKLERANDDPNGQYDVIIDQVKDKYGTLRFYYSSIPEAEDEIDQWIDECEEELAEIDPHYGEPW